MRRWQGAVAEDSPEGCAGEGVEEGEEFDGVAGFGADDLEEHEGAEEDVEGHVLPEGWPVAGSGDGESDDEQVKGGVGEGELGFSVVEGVLPPADVDGEVFDAGTEGHVEDASDGQAELGAPGVVGLADLGEGFKAGVDGRGERVGSVVVREELRGLGTLLGRVEGPVGQAGDVEVVVVAGPVDLVGAGEVEAPSAGPVFPAGVDGFSGVGSGARGEGLEDMEDGPVASSPEGEWGDGEQGAEDGAAQRGAQGDGWAAGEDECGPESDGDQCPVGAGEGGEGDGGGEEKQPGPGVWVGLGGSAGGLFCGVEVLLESPEGDHDGGDGYGFGEPGDGVDGGEGAEGGDPEGIPGGAEADGAADEVCEEEAGDELEGDLNGEDRGVVGDAEEGVAGGEEEWVAGEAEEGGVENSAGQGGGELVMEEEIFRHVAVDLCIDVGRGEGVAHPEAENEATKEGWEDAPAQPAYTGVGTCNEAAAVVLRFPEFRRCSRLTHC